uniref:Uncharacterized protein n=1 Tax=Tetranychus urticae TaxID=32264 RepID=T1KCR0_TETUR
MNDEQHDDDEMTDKLEVKVELDVSKGNHGADGNDDNKVEVDNNLNDKQVGYGIRKKA